LGQHTALPLPPPFADLTALLAALSPGDQAVVQAQWETLRGELQALLDGRTFAPPPEPSNPARWRPVIEAAIAASRDLAMRYFTAGRNLLTQRNVTPYWIEEHRGIPYLRADCHLAGSVRLFRLDRILELTEVCDSGKAEAEIRAA
jgi:predicted DNA-binding transcriptional regulator YafY